MERTVRQVSSCTSKVICINGIRSAAKLGWEETNDPDENCQRTNCAHLSWHTIRVIDPQRP